MTLQNKLSSRAQIQAAKHNFDSKGLADQFAQFEGYRFRPVAYAKKFLGVNLWSGKDSGTIGQLEVVQHYRKVLMQLHERKDFQDGVIKEKDLVYWQPGQEIQDTIVIDTGHNWGKTFILAVIVCHFFDCFPSIGYTYAPTKDQLKDLIWKEIKALRKDRGLPGEILELTLRESEAAEHFIKGKVTSDALGTGGERSQGQHHEYLLFVGDESEGIPKFVFDSIKSMASGGISISIFARNPKTNKSPVHKLKANSRVLSLTASSLNHPNLIYNKTVIPGAITRQYVFDMLKSCEKVFVPDEEKYSFQLPWDKSSYYIPSREFLWRILGIAPDSDEFNTFCSPGRFDAAVNRKPFSGDPNHVARIGVDVARYGDDYGTIYVRSRGRVWRHAKIEKLDSVQYYGILRELILDLKKKKISDIQVRIDAGGGYGSGAKDLLKNDYDLRLMQGIELSLIEVHNNGVPFNTSNFYDIGTELYYYAGIVLQALSIFDPPNELKADLTERTFGWRVYRGTSVRKLQDKEQFKKENDHGSPDDGDGFALAVAPDHLFFNIENRQTRKKQEVYRTEYKPVVIGNPLIYGRD